MEPENHISFVRVGIGKAFSKAQLTFGDVPAASPALRSTADSGFDCAVHFVSVLRLGQRGLVQQETFFRVVTVVGFSFLYVFVVFEQGRRKVIHFSTTCHPSMAWVIQQLVKTTPFGRQPEKLFATTS